MIFIKRYYLLLVCFFLIFSKLLSAQSKRYGIYSKLNVNLYEPFSKHSADFKEMLIPAYSIGFLIRFDTIGKIVPETGLSLRTLRRAFDLSYNFRNDTDPVGIYYNYFEHIEQNATAVSVPFSLGYQLGKTVLKIGILNALIFKLDRERSYAYIQNNLSDDKEYIQLSKDSQSYFFTEFFTEIEYEIFKNTVIRLDGRYNANTGNYRTILPEYVLSLGMTYFFDK